MRGRAKDRARQSRAAPIAPPRAGRDEPAPDFRGGYPTESGAARLRDELLYVNAVTAYLWALPVLSLYAMKEASERTFGKGYHVLPIWKERIDARTLIPAANCDVIYAMGYLDLKQDGPIVIEVPPGLQGVLDDVFQRPLRSVGRIDGRTWSGDVGLPGPDGGRGGRYLILPPDFDGSVPSAYYAYRSRTFGVFVLWRGFFHEPGALDAPVRTMEQTRIYPLAAGVEARTMQFPNASAVPVNMLAPRDDGAFDVLKRFIDHEFVDCVDVDMRGVLAAIGIARDRPFDPTERARAVLAKGAKRAAEMAHLQAYALTGERDDAKYYDDRQWINPFPPVPGNPEFAAPTYTDVDLRAGFFAAGYSTSAAMVHSTPDVGAKYPCTFKDADGEYLMGDRSYRLRLPPRIPARIFWSVSLYDAETASGLDNGQPFPSISAMDQPATNADGSVDIWIGPRKPDAGNWLATVPHKGFFVIVRLFGPTRAFFDRTWTLGDVERVDAGMGP
jgi:hypothetical protein